MPYAKPRHGATDGTGNHRTSKRRLVRPQFLCRQLLDSFVDAKIQAGSNCVAHRMEMETRVQAAKPIPANNLPDRLDCAEAWSGAQRWVPHRIGRRLGTVSDQDGCLHNVLGQFKGTYRISNCGGWIQSRNLHASGEVIRPAMKPAAVKVKRVDTVGLLPGVL